MTCVWTPDASLLSEDFTEMDQDYQDRALLLATSALVNLTNGRVGTCPITVRPCPNERPCNKEWEPYQWLSGRYYGMWLNSCGCSTAHWCAPVSEVDLEGPVGYISEIWVDGVDLLVEPADAANWRIDNGHLLVWQGEGASPLPETQDLNKPLTEVGTWGITYSRSYPIGAEGEIAVAHMAMEFAKAFKPKGKCSLPRGVTSVARNGVNFTIEAGLFPNGLTGLDLVDQFILKWAPAGAPRVSARVFSPRTAGKQRRTTSALPVSRNPATQPMAGGTF